ncbi:MAG: helicase-exonuclease AddAB subunit AddA [Clostridia bacterium]|nr:helicase-exonuclease AddAB subunit AddA [Clostridia bacterium]
MGVKWTPEQKRAIELPSGQGNILVSAAAGSGKTAVLVERIFSKVSGEKRDIDSFLVVTFTKAAAEGMKEKIEQRFRNALENGEDETEKMFWNRQLRLLDMTEITTIDAFCLNVLKNNFQHLGIDPNFFIMDNVEYILMRERAADKLFENYYKTGDEGFFRLVDRYAGFRSDSGLVKVIFAIYDFISYFAEPIKWLEEKAAAYKKDAGMQEWGRLLMDGYLRPYAVRTAATAEGMLDELLNTATGLNESFLISEHAAEETRTVYGRITDSLELIHTAMTELAEVSDIGGIEEWCVRYDSGSALLAENMPSRITNKLREIEGFEEYMKRTKELKQSIESTVKGLMISEADFDSDTGAELADTAALLARVTAEFEAELINAKHKRNAYTFLDIEHMVYELFRDNEDVRREYTNRYGEILIDEYQDTNGLQDAIFKSISHDNIFMVGDLKQSIYRFRGGDPYIFKDKASEYVSEESSGTKVELAKNFRSRPEVIDSVNAVFDSVMSERAGDVDYSGGERLVCGQGGEKEDFYRSELHLIANIKSGGETSDYIEAEHAADVIKELHGKEFYDAKLGIRRNLRYSDFTILLRAVKNSAAVYSEVFEKYGIPLFAELNDYFENGEVQAMTALLNVIDNAHRDVPLMTALRSALFGFSDEDIAYIRINFGRGGVPLYESLKRCAAGGGDMSGRCRKAVGSIERWREYTKQKSVANLIWTIYEETGFYDCAAAAGGEASQANLRLLYERAKQYESSGIKGLFSFTRYIENLKERSEDMSGARVLRHDAVGLMTIHKSKGLEFPVVILGGMGKKSLVHKPDGDGRAALHKDFGMGLMYPDVENEYYASTPYKQLVELQNKREDISEKMRILYVAMTRPQYKMIVMGTYVFADDDKLEEKKEQWRNALTDGKMDSEEVISAQTYGDWIIPAAMASSDWEVKEIKYQKSEDEPEEKTESEPVPIAENGEELKKAVYSLLDYRYPYEKSTVIPSRTTATEMKEIRREKKKLPYVGGASRPAFLSDKKDSAKRGTAYHDSVAYIDLEKMRRNADAETVQSELERLAEEGRIDALYIDEEMVEKILAFFNGELGRRMLSAKQVYRERNFQTLMNASEYEGDGGGADEMMILQGVIDCFFVEDDGRAVLIDYKTDKIINGDVSVAVDNYTLQLELYAGAIKSVAGIDINEKYLYLFDINDAVAII